MTQMRIAIHGGTAAARDKRMKNIAARLEGSLGQFTHEPKTALEKAWPIPYGAPVTGLKFDHIIVDDADALPQDRMDYAAIMSWASTLVTVFPQDGGRTRTTSNRE